MVERVSASITIGGVLNNFEYGEFCQVVAAGALAIEWDGDPFEPHHRIAGQALRLYAYDVPYGRFEDLEAWCIAFKLPFVRWSGAYSGRWGAQRCVFTTTGELTTYPADEDDDVVINRSKVEALGSYAAILGYFSAADWAVPPLVVTGEESNA